MLRPATFFVSPGDPFKSKYGFQRKGACVDLVTHHNKRYTCTHHTPALRENFLLTPLSINPLSGLTIETFMRTVIVPRVYFLGGLVTKFVSASGPNTPCDVTCRPSFDAI